MTKADGAGSDEGAGGGQGDGEEGRAGDDLEVAGQELQAVPVVLAVGRVVAVGPGAGGGVVDQPPA